METKKINFENVTAVDQVYRFPGAAEGLALKYQPPGRFYSELVVARPGESIAVDEGPDAQCLRSLHGIFNEVKPGIVDRVKHAAKAFVEAK